MSDPHNPIVDIDAVVADTKKLQEQFKDIIDLHKSPDMSTEKVLTRIGIVSVMGGNTRTTALGSLFYTAMVAPIVGLSKESLLAALEAAYDASANLATTPALAAQYMESNTKALAEAQSFDSIGDGKAVMVPGSGKAH